MDQFFNLFGGHDALSADQIIPQCIKKIGRQLTIELLRCIVYKETIHFSDDSCEINAFLEGLFPPRCQLDMAKHGFDIASLTKPYPIIRLLPSHIRDGIDDQVHNFHACRFLNMKAYATFNQQLGAYRQIINDANYSFDAYKKFLLILAKPIFHEKQRKLARKSMLSLLLSQKRFLRWVCLLCQMNC